MGLMICKKYKFRGGFYFFLLLLIKHIYSLVYPFIIQELMNNRLYFQSGTDFIYLSQIFAIFEVVIHIIAFLILVVSLYSTLTSNDVVGKILKKIKLEVLEHKKVTAIIIFIILFIMVALLMFVGGFKDFELISAKVQITNNPSTGISSSVKEGDEGSALPNHYIEYTFLIKNKSSKQYGDSRNFVELDFIPSKELLLSVGKELLSDKRGYNGPGFFEAKNTREFKIVYGISDHDNFDMKLLEDQLLNGQLILSLNRKKIQKFELGEY